MTWQLLLKWKRPTLITWTMTYWKSTAFPRGCYQALSSPFLRREPGGEATQYLGNTIYQQSPLPLQSSISALFRLQSHSWRSSTLHGSYVARKYHRHPSFLVIYTLEYMQLYTILLFYCLYSRSMCEQKHCELMQIWWECLQHPQMQISMLFGSLVLIGNSTYSQCSYSGSTSYVSERSCPSVRDSNNTLAAEVVQTKRC